MSASAAEAALAFDAEFLRRLEALDVVARKVLQGSMRADRNSARKGTSAEFADHRPYVPGDDIRHVDWHLFGRLEELFLKLYREEENLHLTLLVDASASASFVHPGPRPAEAAPSKLVYALQVAAALAYIGLSNMDAVNVLPFADRLLEGRWRLKGRAQIHGLFQTLREWGARGGAGTTDVARTTRELITRERRRGVVVVLSDFYDLDGFRAGLKQLRYPRHEVYAIHLSDPLEADPPLRGDLRLVDAETGAAREVNVTDDLRRRYKEAYAGLQAAVERFCVQNELGYVRASLEVPFDELVLGILRRGGLIG
ncbi:MAG: DUF58 domain-containing protein [Planctomycetota bacterium]